jgi:DNA-binding NarL/FixJ family response regulator
LDISLKGDIDGIELARLLTGKYPEMPVVMLSMHDIAAYGVRAREAGASGYLSKGDTPSFLVKVLRRVLAGHQAFGPADLVESVSDW